MLVIVGAGITYKGRLLLATPATVTATVPLVAPMGTLTVMELALQLIAAPAPIPLNITTPEPWLEPKLLPEIDTTAPTGAMLGFTELTEGAGRTVKFTPLLDTPPTVTTTGPVVAPPGTFTTMLVAVQLVAVPALVPLNVTVLVPWLAPKLGP